MKFFFKILLIAFLVAGIGGAGCGSKAVKKTEVREPVPVKEEGDQYVIGPEDVLKIDVWKEPALSGTVAVRMDGKITLPLINDVEATGLTTQQLQEKLVKKLEEYIESPNVSVTVTEANSFKVYVSGQVKNPGVFKLRSQMTLLQIIPMAGGFTDWANPKKVVVFRKEGDKENRMTVNYKLMMNGKVPPLILKSGDTIVVP